MRAKQLFSALLLLLSAGCAARPIAPQAPSMTEGGATFRYPYQKSPLASIDPYAVQFSRNMCADSAFDQEDQGDMKAALEEWNHGFQGLIHLTFNQGPCQWRVVMGSPDDATLLADKRTAAHADVLGGSIIYIFRDHIRSQAMLRQIMRHEIGHLMGATHSRDDQGLMSQYYYPFKYACVDAYALQAACTYNHLLGCAHYLNPCIKE